MYRLCIPMAYDYVIYTYMTGRYSTVKPAGKWIRLVSKFAEVILFDKGGALSNTYVPITYFLRYTYKRIRSEKN